MNFYTKQDTSHVMFYRDDLDATSPEALKKRLTGLHLAVATNVVITLRDTEVMHAASLGFIIGFIRTLTLLGKSVSVQTNSSGAILLNFLGLPDFVNLTDGAN
ncbi:MAG: hypothetical protein K8S54_01775 [Spirochaetia bacterium]|nr:hypothetical protein [Spirochaetia bacterium]